MVIHTVKGFSIINEAEVRCFFSGIFLLSLWSNRCWQFDFWFPCLSKSILYICNFLVHVLLKPSLKDFKHDHASRWNECNCVVSWTFFGIALLWDWNETDLFESGVYCWVFQIFWHLDCRTLTASSFRVLNSSAGIPSHSLALFIVMPPKAHSRFRMSDSRWVTTSSWLSWSLRPFLYSSSVCSCHFFLMSLACLRSLPFLFFPSFHEMFPWYL